MPSHLNQSKLYIRTFIAISLLIQMSMSLKNIHKRRQKHVLWRVEPILISNTAHELCLFAYLFSNVRWNRNVTRKVFSLNVQNLPCCIFSRKLLVWLFNLLKRGVKSTAMMSSACDVSTLPLLLPPLTGNRPTGLRALLPSTGSNTHYSLYHQETLENEFCCFLKMIALCFSH